MTDSRSKAEDLVKTPTLAQPGWAPVSDKPPEQISQPFVYSAIVEAPTRKAVERKGRERFGVKHFSLVLPVRSHKVRGSSGPHRYELTWIETWIEP